MQAEGLAPPLLGSAAARKASRTSPPSRAAAKAVPKRWAKARCMAWSRCCPRASHSAAMPSAASLARPGHPARRAPGACRAPPGRRAGRAALARWLPSAPGGCATSASRASRQRWARPAAPDVARRRSPPRASAPPGHAARSPGPGAWPRSEPGPGPRRRSPRGWPGGRRAPPAGPPGAPCGGQRPRRRRRGNASTGGSPPAGGRGRWCATRAGAAWSAPWPVPGRARHQGLDLGDERLPEPEVAGALRLQVVVEPVQGGVEALLQGAAPARIDRALGRPGLAGLALGAGGLLPVHPGPVDLVEKGLEILADLLALERIGLLLPGLFLEVGAAALVDPLRGGMEAVPEGVIDRRPAPGRAPSIPSAGRAGVASRPPWACRRSPAPPWPPGAPDGAGRYPTCATVAVHGPAGPARAGGPPGGHNRPVAGRWPGPDPPRPGGSGAGVRRP